ncbi:hypothetical protein [Agromyces sp. NPDC049794]|uniref:hypothetical protein n=1 Tax=unclassified Agromyces TaxID=2639701 RepID=UPI0033E8DE87
MALGYRTILTADPTEDNLNGIIKAFSGWITGKKGYSELPSSGSLTHLSGATLTAASYASDDGTVSAKRWTIIEDWAPPKWYDNPETSRTGVTNVTLALAEHLLWLWVDVEPPTLIWTNTNGREVEEVQMSGRPTFVQDILNTVNMSDGAAEPLSEFQVIASQGHVDELARILSDSERMGAVFVTATPDGTDSNEWADKITKLAGQIQGMGIGYTLTPEARVIFNRQHGGAGHWVSPGAMRTFLPGVDLSDRQDAFKHRLLHASTLRDSTEARIRRILRNAQLKRLNALRIPDALREVDFEFLRKERLQPFAVLHEPVSTDSPSEDEATVWRALAELAESEVKKGLTENKELARRASLAESLLEEVQAENDVQYAQLTAAREEAAFLTRQVDYLRRELTDLGGEGAASAWSFVDEEVPKTYPDTFAELLDRVDGLSGVKFTGDIEDALELDEHTVLGQAAVMKTWDALLTFDNYSRARHDGAFDHSLSNFITHQNHGHRVQIGKIVWTEGETVKNNDKYRAQRMLPVDRKVDPSGKTLMVAHLKLSNLTGVAPRLYFKDTYSDVGYVTVGYLGSHMDNTLTN